MKTTTKAPEVAGWYWIHWGSRLGDPIIAYANDHGAIHLLLSGWEEDACELDNFIRSIDPIAVPEMEESDGQ